MYAKKSLGQHFLTSARVVERIVETARVSANDMVLEVGPGKGVLTEKLLQRAKKVIAVEKDARLMSYLTNKFEDEIAGKKLQVVNDDILSFSPTRFALCASRYKVVANIPYYITGEFLRTMLSGDVRPSSMTLLVQKEVAERIARSQKESVLSISVKAYGEPHYIQTVSRGNFSPPPEVDSAILHIENISKERLKDVPESLFFEVVKTGFGQKRKRLIRNLETVVSSDALVEAFGVLGLDTQIRAENVPGETWIALVQAILKKRG